MVQLVDVGILIYKALARYTFRPICDSFYYYLLIQKHDLLHKSKIADFEIKEKFLIIFSC
jgi:hypothetical protein